MRSRKKRLGLKEIASRITGFSTPFGGISWKAPTAERDEVRRFLTALEDRRVLFNSYHLEIESQVTHSVTEIRQLCTDVLVSLSEKSPATGPLRAIRAACRRFLDEPREDFRNFDHYGFGRQREGPGFFTSLGELRATIGAQIAILAVHYRIELEAELASIIPAEDKDRN